MNKKITPKMVVLGSAFAIAGLSYPLLNAEVFDVNTGFQAGVDYVIATTNGADGVALTVANAAGTIEKTTIAPGRLTDAEKWTVSIEAQEQGQFRLRKDGYYLKVTTGGVSVVASADEATVLKFAENGGNIVDVESSTALITDGTTFKLGTVEDAWKAMYGYATNSNTTVTSTGLGEELAIAEAVTAEDVVAGDLAVNVFSAKRMDNGVVASSTPTSNCTGFVATTSGENVTLKSASDYLAVKRIYTPESSAFELIAGAEADATPANVDGGNDNKVYFLLGDTKYYVKSVTGDAVSYSLTTDASEADVYAFISGTYNSVATSLANGSTYYLVAGMDATQDGTNGIKLATTASTSFEPYSIVAGDISTSIAEAAAIKFTGVTGDFLKVGTAKLGVSVDNADNFVDNMPVTLGGDHDLAVTVKDGVLVAKDAPEYHVVYNTLGTLALYKNPNDCDCNYHYIIVSKVGSGKVTAAPLYTAAIEDNGEYVLVSAGSRTFSLTGATGMVYTPSTVKIPTVASYGEFESAKKWTVELDGDSARLKTAEGYLQYTVSEDGAVAMTVAPTAKSKFFLGGETITSKYGENGQYALKLAAEGVSLVKDDADAKVNMYADITPNTDGSGTNYDENGTVIGTPADNAVLYFNIGGKFLATEDGNVVLIDEVEAGNEQNASWVFEKPTTAEATSNGGYYKSVATGKYLTVADDAIESKAASATIFTLSSTPSTVVEIKADNSVTVVNDGQTQTPAVLGFAQGQLTTSKKAEGVQLVPATGTLKKSTEIIVPQVTVGDYVDGDNYVAGEYYVLSVGGDKAVRYDAASGKCVLTATPDNASAVDLWKMVETKVGDKYTYSFVSKSNDKVFFAIGGENTFIGGVKSYKDAGAIQLRTDGGLYVAVGADGNLVLAATTDKAVVLCKAGELAFDGDWMNARLGSGFEISIMDQAKEKYTGDDLKNNPFKGVLKAVNTRYTSTGVAVLSDDNNTIASDQAEFFLRNADGDYLALNMNTVYGDDNESMNGANAKQRGYKFTAISADDYNYLFKKGDDKDKPVNYKFKFKAVYSSAAAKLSYDLPFMLEVETANNTWVRLYVTRFEDEYVLTSSKYLSTGEEWPLIKFEVTGLVKKNTWLGQAVNIEYVHTGAHALPDMTPNFGKQVSTANRRVDATWYPVDTVYCQFDKPEGQWIVTESGADGYFCLVNRESGKHIDLKDVYHTNQDNVYAVVTVSENHGSFDTKLNAHYGVNDTLRITVAPSHNKFTGYANFDAKALETQAFNLSVVSELSGKVYTTEPDGGHKVGLSKDVKEAAEWRLVKFETGVVKGKEYNQSNVDSIISTIKWNDKDGKAQTDSLVAFVYALRNDKTGEYLKYDADKQAYIVEKAAANKAYNASKFILKEKRNGAYNIIPANYSEKYITDYTNSSAVNSRSKLYGAFSELKLNKQSNIYKLTDNDLFKLDEIGAPIYVGAEKINFNDTIKIVKNSNDRYVMFEQGHFLGMQHVADVEKMAPAMFVDTAFVRGGTYKPQYMLVVKPELKWHDANCGIEGHPAVAPTLVDNVKGRFLVNMVDSAKAYGLSKHDNPYIWENNRSYKLSFLDGNHTKDSLYLNVTDAKGNAKVDTIFMGNNENRIGKYAFRYVDREAGSFTIETSYDGTDKVGYIKYLNGVLSVVADPTQAEVFNLSKTSDIPTSNEDVQISGISVIGGNGEVTIKGAEGKTVVITNVLGQAVANTVLSSDNATISAPAGVIVVAVEGEAAVKAIVK